MELSPAEILRGVVTPGMVCLLVLVVAWRAWRVRGTEPVGTWAGGLAVGLGFALGYALVESKALTFLPFAGGLYEKVAATQPTAVVTYRDWWPVLGWGAGLVGVLHAVLAWLYPRARVGVRLASAELLTVGVLAAVLWTKAVNAWTPTETLAWVLVAGLGLRVTIASAETLSEPWRTSGWVMPLVLTLTTGVAAVAAGTSGARVLAQHTGVLAAALGATFVLAAVIRRFTLARGGAAAAAALLGGLLLVAHVYSQLPRRDLLLIGLAPMAAWASQLSGLRRRPWLAAFVAVIAVLIPLGIAGYFAQVRLVELLKSTEYQY
jgi:hypothetical protein